VNLLT